MSQAPYVVEVALPIPKRQTFEYLVDAADWDRMSAGCRVTAPFGRQSLVGIVVNKKREADYPIDKLKPLSGILDEQSIFPEAMFNLLLWASHYYQHPIGEVFHTAIPALLRKGESSEIPQALYWRVTVVGAETSLEELKSAPKQQALLESLQVQSQSDQELRQEFSKAQLTALQEKALIEDYWSEPAKPQSWQHNLVLGDKPFATPEQGVAISAIKNQSSFHVTLLEGVTGSGKTEVYLQSIEQALTDGKQVLVLVPEIGLTPQTVERFRTRFNVEVGIWHSGLTDRERLLLWQQSSNNELGIVIGTRSAVFLPFQQLAMVIVDEEHDGSFKQSDGFKYHARDLAVMRAKQQNIPLILGSATPSLETLNNALSKKYTHLQLHVRTGTSQHLSYQLIDLRQQALEWGLAPATRKQIYHHLSQGNQVLVFLNRRGYAPALLCHHCGHVEQCQQCDLPYTLHRSKGQLQCHHCGHTKFAPATCQNCGHHDIAPLGLGTEQIEEGLASLFPQFKGIRIDSDAVRGKTRLQEVLNDAASKENQLLIGTQILAKGHHFPNVTLVVVVDIDSALFSADYRSSEQLAQLITQISGRAGRADKAGEVWLQTHHPDHPLLQDLLNNGYGHFARQLLLERQQANLPPQSFHALFRAEATNSQLAHKFLLDVQNISAGHSIQKIGPVPALIEKRQGRFRFQLLLQSQTRKALNDCLNHTLPMIEQLDSGKKVRWSVDVDPQDFY